jgi:hypothetical protein
VTRGSKGDGWAPRRIRWRQRGIEREEEEPNLRTARDQSGPAAEKRLQKRKRSQRSAASLAGEEAFCHQKSRFPRPPPTWRQGLQIPRRRLRNNAKPANSPPQPTSRYRPRGATRTTTPEITNPRNSHTNSPKKAHLRRIWAESRGGAASTAARTEASTGRTGAPCS